MIGFRTLSASVLCAAIFCSVSAAQDFSKYRDFKFGMSVDAVSKLATIDASRAQTLFQRPQVIQRLDWELHTYFDKSPSADSLRSIRFDFYNDELFKIVVIYDTEQTKGLTADDVVEALSALYGPAGNPETTIVVSAFQTYRDNQQVLARWENAQYSYNLFRSSYGMSFGLVAFSKRLESMASAANVEAERLDKLEEPARERARQQKQKEAEQALQQKNRRSSKSTFRP